MAMKKKFLGLAMAAMVAMPATGVYAAGNPQIRVEDENSTFTHSVAVSGEVKKSDGSAAAGKITVELPTTMAFTVDEKSDFIGATYNVDNKSGCGIDISVSQFSPKNNAITLVKKSDMTTYRDQINRSYVSMALTGNVGGTQKTVDLAEVAESKVDQPILNIAARSQATMALSGTAGTLKVTDPASSNTPAGVDKDGARGEFTLVFKIKKDAQSPTP